MSKNQSSPSLTLDSGSYNQTITLGDLMQLIVFTFGGSTTSVTITGTELQDISQSGNTITISGDFDDTGTNTGTITTIISGDCNEITQSIGVTVNAPVANTSGNTTSGNTSTSYNLDVTASNSSDYTLSGTDRNGNISGSDPNLTFSVGDTISFVVNASGHPFYLKTVAGTGTGNTISGVTNNGTESATISWTPTATGTFYYQCSLHGGMVGTITIQ